MKRSKSVIFTDINQLAAPLDNAFSGVVVAFECGMVQDVESALVPQCEIHRRSRRQCFDDLGVLLADCVVQRRVAVRILNVDITSMPEKHLNACRELLVDSHVKWSTPTFISAVNFGRMLDQKFHDIRLISVPWRIGCC